MTVCVHLCRGNYAQGMGGYEPIAERMFDQLDVDDYRRLEAPRRRGLKIYRPRSLCLSPQCGFASVPARSGRGFAMDLTERKLARVVEVAREIWERLVSTTTLQLANIFECRHSSLSIMPWPSNYRNRE
jgi:hypothetical protein